MILEVQSTIYQLFLNSLGNPQDRVDHWGVGGGGILGITGPSPSYPSFFTHSFNLNYSRSPAGGLYLKLGKTSDNFECS